MKTVLLHFTILFALAISISCSPDFKSGRILGGQTAAAGAFPFMASLRTTENAHFCGGWVHNNRWIITAAHCGRNRTADGIIVHLGTISRVLEGIRHPIVRIVSHPEYNSNAVANNIAMLQTVNPIALVGQVSNIPVTNINTVGGMTVSLPGWGLTARGGNMSDDLLWISSMTMTREACLAQHSNLNRRFIYEETLCTSSTLTQGMCTGDGGGPVVSGEGATRQVVGVMSWNMPCGTGTPDVSVRVFSYTAWIEETART